MLSRGKNFLYPVILLLTSCILGHNSVIKRIDIGLHNNNELRIQVDVQTNQDVPVYVEYWLDSLGKNFKSVTPVSDKKLFHSFVLTNILPDKKYSFQVVAVVNGKEERTKNYSFQSHDLPVWLKERFRFYCDSPQFLPPVFKEGYMLLNKREAPGIIYLIDYKGGIRWYNMFDEKRGVKVTHFTKDSTIISILGNNDEQTSYGSEILELNLTGDTLLYLKKGQGDFKSTIHHEIIKNDKGQIVTLFVDQRIMDLTSIGGKLKDTVNGDGIIIFDKHANAVWKWSVFDVLDPLKDRDLLKNKKDWMHANSVNYDKDNNFILSFYNNGQIWKINGRTGNVIWKIGKGGNIKTPSDLQFSQAHAAHYTNRGTLLFFNNGIDKHQTEVYELAIDETSMSAQIETHIKLPKEIYNDRMGSAYAINDSLILCCSSKRHIITLVNKKGVLYWTLETAVPSYRAEFISEDKVRSWLYPYE